MPKYLLKICCAILITAVGVGITLGVAAKVELPPWMVILFGFGVFALGFFRLVWPSLDAPYEEDAIHPLIRDKDFLDLQFVLRSIFGLGFGFVLSACVLLLTFPIDPNWSIGLGVSVAIASGAYAVWIIPRPQKTLKPFP